MSRATSSGEISGGSIGSDGGRRGGGGGDGGGRGTGRGTGGGGRSALISDLVAQLKRGDITKTELFSRLQQLQGPQAGVTSKAATDGVDGASGSAAGGDAVPGNTIAAGGQHGSGSPETVTSGESSVTAAGKAAAESAGFFSAYDRQVRESQHTW